MYVHLNILYTHIWRWSALSYLYTKVKKVNAKERMKHRMEVRLHSERPSNIKDCYVINALTVEEKKEEKKKKNTKCSSFCT